MSVGQNSGCGTSGEGGTSGDRIPGVRHSDEMAAEKNSGTPEWNGGGEDSGSETPGQNGGGEDFGCETPGWNGGGEDFRVRDIRRRQNVVMSSMKDRYGLHGYGGLGEWF